MFEPYETSRFVLRELEERDLPALFENLSDPVLMRYYDIAPLKSLEEADDLLFRWRMLAFNGTGLRWAITRKDSDYLIGTCGFHCIDRVKGRAQIGYEINRDFWGRGVLSEVLPAALTHAFNVLFINQITALIAPENVASVALVTKFGFQNGGLISDQVTVNGKSIDMLSFSLMRAAHPSRVHTELALATEI